MKRVSLLIQSLSPIAILTIIKIFPINLFVLFKRLIKNPMDVCRLYWRHITTIDKDYLILTFCFVVICWALISYWLFRDSLSVGTTNNYSINAKLGNEDASLNFFFFFLFPLVIDDFSSWNSFVFYFVTILITVRLLWDTTLFYKNPVLTVLGYNIYNFTFDDNPDEPKEELIGICHGEIQTETIILYKKLFNKVYFIKEIKNEKK